MFLPISRILICSPLLVLLAGCENNSNSDPQTESEQAKQAANEGKVECALAGSEQFERQCVTEQITTPDSVLLVLRHPDGGFRRFNVVTDGRGLTAADGFDETRISLLSDGMIELTSGDDKYRLPAQIKNPATDGPKSTVEDAS